MVHGVILTDFLGLVIFDFPTLGDVTFEDVGGKVSVNFCVTLGGATL